MSFVMEMRLDHLLHKLRCNPAPILEAIDGDPLLLKRESGPLVLANASQALYTPQAEHQLFAKGIVYRRHPYRLVSLPLVKIYNLGERDVTVADLTELTSQPNARLHFLRKIDGSLVQVFRHEGRICFTTRGAIEGPSGRSGRDNGEDGSDFDYLGTARRLAAERYPRLLDDDALLDGRTLIFELIHPRARKVTDYGERSDLILLACFNARRLGYAPYAEVSDVAERHGLTVVDALTPAGATLAEQIESLLGALSGTDQEGSVLQFENAEEVIYRVKVKSAGYLRLLRAMAECTYDNLAALMNDNPHLVSWQEVAALLRQRGRDAVPEEVLAYYRPHYERFRAYLADCARLCQWALDMSAQVERQLGGRAGKDAAAYRKSFAAVVKSSRHAKLLFAALDGRLNRDYVRRWIGGPEQVRQALVHLGL
jgi:hypothetical protein